MNNDDDLLMDEFLAREQEPAENLDAAPRVSESKLILDIVKTLSQNQGKTGMSYTPEKFTGKRNDDVVQWLVKFDNIARFNGWSEAQKSQALGLYILMVQPLFGLTDSPCLCLC